MDNKTLKPFEEIQGLIEEFLVIKSELTLPQKTEAQIDHMIAELESEATKDTPNITALRNSVETVKGMIKETPLITN